MQREALTLAGYRFAYRYDEVSSTMDVARDLLPEVEREPESAGLIVADRQSAGRGRQGRHWSGASDAFMGTYLFSTVEPIMRLSGYSLMVGAAIATAFERLSVPVLLKWPNDVVTVEKESLKKVGGILIEVQECASIRVLLVGIGLNLGAVPDDVPHAASAREVSGLSITRDKLIGPLSDALLDYHNRFVTGAGSAGFLREWEARSCFIPGVTELRVEVGPRTVWGVYEGIEPSGALRMNQEGTIEVIHSGHIVSTNHVGRPAPHRA